MIPGLADGEATAPILVLGLGNILLGDDGFGPHLTGMLAERFENETGIEFLDGGTQGLALLGRLANRQAVVILDALAPGKAPGTVSVLNRHDVRALGGSRASTAHEGNALELLAGAALLGDLPEQVYVVGMEPGSLRTGIGLSHDVQASLTRALERAEDIVRALLAKCGAAAEVWAEASSS